MTSRERRRELRAAYAERRPDAGVYALRNTATGRVLLGSSTDLGAVRNRLAFGQATNSTGVLDRRLVADARTYGLDVFVCEVLDTLDVRPDMTAAQIRDDLQALEALWRERLADTLQY